MRFSGRNQKKKLICSIILMLLVVSWMGLARSRGLKGRKINDDDDQKSSSSVKAVVVYVAGPVPPSASSSCTHIGNNGGAPCHGP